MSNSDEVQLSYAFESEFGVSPGGTFKRVRFTSESLATVTGTTRSAEIRPDRQTSDVLRTQRSTAGDVGFELIFEAHDDFLAAALFSSGFSSAVTLVDDASIGITGATGVVAATGIDTNAVVGGWVQIDGTENNDGFYKILAVGEDQITVAGLTAMTDETISATVTMGGQIVNGTTQRSMLFEKVFSDLSNDIAEFLGQVPGGFSMDVPATDVINCTLSLEGSTEESRASSSGSDYDDAPTNDTMTAANDALAVIEGTPVVNATNTRTTNQLSFAIANNLRARNVIGLLGVESYGAGKFNPTGSLEVFYDGPTLINKNLNYGKSALAFIVQDTAGNAYVFEFPRIRYTNGRRVAGGENTDVLAEMEWEAILHETEDVTMRIVRFPVA